MLQRAASNAYSWWWAGHIRTKQSKWLEQSLLDMEDKVQGMLKLIEEDGDSFAKRAEMYYKRRPELINFVEESYRAYRALAERYDHISTELQNANHTIATVFPERVQFAMDDDDDDYDCGSPKPPRPLQQAPTTTLVPNVPDIPNQDLKGFIASTAKKLEAKKTPNAEILKKSVPKSGLSKAEALEEIDSSQKEILALQTVKEFIKSSYENGLTKYWEIENRIAELQKRINSLQDEFKMGKAFEDGEARTIMAEAALKSCEETLKELNKKQEKSAKEAREESERVEDAGKKIKSLKQELIPDKQENLEADGEVEERQERDEELRDKIMEHFDGASNSKDSKESLTVTQLVIKIDQLVTKVINLETAVSSQTALTDRLRTENDDLHAQIRTLEDEKANLIEENKNLIKRLGEMEQQLKRLQHLNQDLENQNNDLKKHLDEARCDLKNLSSKLHSVKPDEEIEHTEPIPEEEASTVGTQTPDEVEGEDLQVPCVNSMNRKRLKVAVKEYQSIKIAGTVPKKADSPHSPKKDDNHIVGNNEQKEVAKGKDHEMSWQEMLLDGVEDREEILLKEYTTILRSYKDLKRKQSEDDTKNQDRLFETAMKVRELKSIISKRDEEVRSLRLKLELLQESLKENEENQPLLFLSSDGSAKSDAIEEPKVNKASEIHLDKEEEEEVVKLILINQPQTFSPVEEELRTKIDVLLDGNLGFWLRFSDTFHQVQKFRTGFQDLQAEIESLKEKFKSKEGSITTDVRDIKPIYKHLTEMQAELKVWIEKSTLLKEELEGRFSSLCDIQEEMTKALTEDAEEKMKFTSHMAAKFQGEVMNMKQENNKVRDELQAGFDHVSALKQEIEKTLKKLTEEFKLSESMSNSQPQLQHSASRNRVPLRSFIFGTKQKKRSFFSYMHCKKKHGARSGLSM
ncbi:hypothetical protein NMG60_11007480 [Bertholletia excelsa]